MGKQYKHHTLRIRALGAKGVPGKNPDPYVIVKCNGETMKTDHEEGSNVSFDEEEEFEIESLASDKILVRLMEHDRFSKDDEVAKCEIAVSKLKFDQPVRVWHKMGSSTVCLDFELFKRGSDKRHKCKKVADLDAERNAEGVTVWASFDGPQEEAEAAPPAYAETTSTAAPVAAVIPVAASMPVSYAAPGNAAPIPVAVAYTAPVVVNSAVPAANMGGMDDGMNAMGGMDDGMSGMGGMNAPAMGGMDDGMGGMGGMGTDSGDVPM